MSIPVDADDRLIIAELKEKASEIKRQCVDNAMTFAKEMTETDKQSTLGQEFETENSENHDSLEEKSMSPENNGGNRSIDVDNVIGTLWINDALSDKKKCVILVDRLSPDHLYSLLPKPDIDPYSSLEDVGDTTSNEKPDPTSNPDEQNVVNSETDSSGNSTKETNFNQNVVNLCANLNSNVDSSNIIEAEKAYCMRTRKPIRHTTGRPRRTCNETVDYRKLDSGYLSCASISPLRKKPKPRADPKREPSKNRILAHQKRFCRKDPASVVRQRRYPIQVYTKPKPLPDPIEDKYDGSTETYDSEEAEVEEVEEKPAIKPKKKTVGVFFYKKHGYGYVKGKSPDQPVRRFKCPEKGCPVVKNKRSEINAHYRNTHKPLTCITCGETFNTPATLD